MKKQKNRTIVIGLTGGFGCGKTTVAGMFSRLGAHIIDADRIAHKISRPGTKIFKKLTDIFGTTILNKGGFIDRKKLGGIIFSNKVLLKKLNAIMHPEILRLMAKEARQSQGNVVVLDAPLLFETGLNKFCDFTAVVRATKTTVASRTRNKAYTATIINKNQMPLREKVRLADFVIDNNGTVSNSRKQVEQIRRKLWIS